MILDKLPNPTGIEWTTWEDGRYPQYRALLPTGFVYVGKTEPAGPWILRGEGVEKLGLPPPPLQALEGPAAVQEASHYLAEKFLQWAERILHPRTGPK